MILVTLFYIVLNDLFYYNCIKKNYYGKYTFSFSGYSMVISSKNTLRGRYGLISPLENLTDTCIQISYRIIGNDCRLEVSALHNNKKSVVLRSLNDTAFHKMQLYVNQAMTRLILEASLWNSWRSPCSVEIEKIELNNGTCPALGKPFYLFIVNVIISK